MGNRLLGGRITHLSQIAKFEMVEMCPPMLGNRMPIIALLFFYMGRDTNT